jgi:amino acid adenylation domain-containing protein
LQGKSRVNINESIMDDHTPFPCQSGHAESQFPEQLSSQDLVVQLEQNLQVSANHDNITGLIQVAYATVIWAYTGEKSVRFISSSSDKSFHQTHSLIISPQTTVADAYLQVARSSQGCGKVCPTVTNILIDVSSGEPAAFSQPGHKIPLQVLFQPDTRNARVRIRIYFDQASIDAFQVDSVGRHLSAQIKLILGACSDARISNFGALLHEDIAYIRALNSQAQIMDYRTVHRCISETAALSPTEVAIEAWDGVLTREELEQESNSLASTLIDAGVERGCVVGIVMDKSVWTPVVMLATLKAGAAFLLLEPTLPFERLKTMTQTARTSHAVTSREHVGAVCSLVATVVVNDGQGNFLLVDKGNNRNSINGSRHLAEVDPKDPAFLIFTSGSSGKPKAIVTQHFAWVTGYTQHIHKFGITQKKRVFQYASYSFVVSILDTLSTLLVGGIVCIPGPEERSNALERVICRLRAEYVCMTPSVAKTIDPTNVPSIRTLVLVGEPIPRSLVEAWLSTSKATLRNGYGQSETCSMNSTATLTRSSVSQRNIGNSTWLRYWVVDPWDHHRLMPVGGLGELLIEGYSVAQEYLDQPDKTAAAFIQRPSWASDFGAGEQGRRWYKTGDLVQYQANGDLFLYGRKDAQLKVHGQRVEAAEIEHYVLKAFHNEIGQVIVDKISYLDQSDAAKLVAFVALLEDRDTPICSIGNQARYTLEKELRDEMVKRLQEHVPMWMIPTAVIVVSKMPRTATGKLDRRTLREDYIASLHPTEKNVQPSTKSDGQVETTCERLGETSQTNLEVLKRLWSRILKVEEDDLSPESRWINVGGDSLAALILVKNATNLGFSFKSVDIMSGMPLIDLCQHRLDPNDLLQTSLQPVLESGEDTNNRRYPTSDFQREYLARTTKLSKDLLYRYIFTFRGTFVPQRLREALKVWIQNTEALRLTFSYSSQGDMLQSVISEHEEIWKLRLYGNDTDKQLELRSSNWDFLKHPVLISVQTNEVVGSETIKMGLHIHHSIFDGMSFNHLLHDLVSIYLGNHVPTRPSFVAYLRLLTQSTNSSDSIRYWKTLLYGSTPTILRTIPGSGIVASHNTQKHDRMIKRDLHLPLGLHGTKKVSMSTLVQSAWSIVLGVISQRADVVFLYLLHGRDEKITNSDLIIGCCVTECPLRVQLDDAMSCEELMVVVQEQVLQAAPHAYLGSNTIAARCTDWPSRERWYQHSSYVQHQTISTNEHIPVEDIGYIDVSEPDIEHKLVYDFDLLTRSTNSRELYLELRCPGQTYTHVEAHATADAFARTLRMLIEGEGSLGHLRQRVKDVPSLPVMSL